MSTKYNIADLKKKQKQNLFKDGPEERAGEKGAVKRGRPEKEKSERLTKKVTVNLTETEFEQLKELSGKNFNIPLPQLIRGLLKEQEII